MVSASVIDEREMEPSFRVSVNKDSFSIFNDENGDPSNEDSKE
uniref:Uncharacterized protein n=1 Tax=Acrobeloides nanus TaxID=290746 RepID=A0A914CWE1_9BILA